MVALLAILLPATALYWRARRALPVYDGELKLAGLQDKVRVVRDSVGVPHITAQSVEDIAFAQGFVHAQERLWQMDLIRRSARGQLAEIFGAVALDSDRENRTLGLGRAADLASEQLAGPQAIMLERYAAGINAYIESRTGSLATGNWPVEFALLGYKPERWRPADSIAVGLRMFKLLTNRWPREMARLYVEERLPKTLAADLYVTRSQYDHPIAQPVATRLRNRRRRRPVIAQDRAPHFEKLHGELTNLESLEKLEAIGASNNWAVAGEHTATGLPLLANDMHLPHSVPATWTINHLSAPDLDVRGFSLPGLPFVVVGHNQSIAWGFTNLNADVQDLFVEHFDADKPMMYLAPGGWRKATTRTETIKVKDAPAETFEVIETRHGPVVRDDGRIKFALQWTALDPDQHSLPFLKINRASNWKEFLDAMRDYGGPTQNAMYADRDGHIGYHAIGRIPERRTGLNYLPVPGDSADFDWQGYIPFDLLPQNFDPPEGYLATANNRVVPGGYPVYVTDHWAAPARVHRIYQVLSAAVDSGAKLTTEDMLQLQGDSMSLPNKFIAEQIVAAATEQGASPEVADANRALELLREWDGNMTADAAAPVIADALRQRLLEALLQPHLGDDWRNYRWWMAPVFLRNVLRERPGRWLPAKHDSWDALLTATLEETVVRLQQRDGFTSLDRLRWGPQVAVRMRHPVGSRLPLLSGWFAVPATEQSGGRYSPKQTRSAMGPSERLVADLSDLDETLINITLGQSGHVTSEHYSDQFDTWVNVKPQRLPYSKASVERDARHTLTLVPR